MSMPIQRQSESYNIFDDGDLRFAKEYTTRDLPAGLVNSLAGPRITAGLNNPRHAGDFDAQYDHSRPSASDLYAHEPHQMGGDEFAQEFPSGEPQHENYDAFREEPPAAVPPLDQMLEHSYRPDPQESVDYHEQFSPHMASFGVARAHEGSGPAPEQKSAAAISPQVVPGWVGHGYVPGHRVGLPWRQQVIPGVVTHLDGQEVGVRWDDGQHSTEEPADLRPL